MTMEQMVENSNNIKLNYQLEEDSFVEVNLMDLSGNLVYNYSAYCEKGLHNHCIKNKRLNGKSYLLRIAKNGHSEIKKVIFN